MPRKNSDDVKRSTKKNKAKEHYGKVGAYDGKAIRRRMAYIEAAATNQRTASSP